MDQQSATSITHFPAVTLANNNTWLRPARSLRVSWQRFHRSHSQLGRCSSIREPCVARGCSFLLRARAGLLLMLLVRLLLRTLLLPRLLCHHRLPPDARTGGGSGSSSSNGSSSLASMFRLYRFGQSWSAIAPSSPDPEKRWSLDFNSLWISRTTEPPFRLSDALSGSTCFTGTVERTAGVASGPDSLNHCC